jgi:hypothetical protein
MIRYPVILLLGALILIAPAARAGSEGGADLTSQNKVLFRQLQEVHGLSDTQMKAVQTIFARSGYMGQGNPAVTRHPAAPQECEANLRRTGMSYENPRFTRICGAKYMAPLYNPAVSQPEDARVCIDQFEFPNIPWYGCGQWRLLSCARPLASASAMPMNGKAHAQAALKSLITALILP